MATADKKSVPAKSAAPVGREQEQKQPTTVTGAGETSVHHAHTEADPDFSEENFTPDPMNSDSQIDRV